MDVIDIMDELQYDEVMAKKLSYKEREGLKDSDFALIQKKDGKRIRRFPIHDCAHARNALARLPLAKDLSPEERAQVKRKAQAKLNSPECKKERKSSTEGSTMENLEQLQSKLEEMTRKYDEQFAAREQAEIALAALQEQVSTLTAKVEELTASLSEKEAALAETITASRARILSLSGMDEKEVEKAKDVIAKMDDDAFNFLLANIKQPKRGSNATGSGGFTPENDTPGKPKITL